MKLYFAGGYGEHGRNCFYVRSESACFLVDCGILPGVADCMPNLNHAQIAAAEFVLLTHSHVDHVGALPWLYGNGFDGTVFLSESTLRQMPTPPRRYQFIDSLTPPLSPCELLPGVTIEWGRSGHCIGSVWYILSLDGRRLIFSGDYTEHSLLYECDPLINQTADAAVLDCAYAGQSGAKNDESLRQAFNAYVSDALHAGKKLILPVPLHGRGHEIAFALHTLLPDIPLFADCALRGQLSQVEQHAFWLRPEACRVLQHLHLHARHHFARQPGPAVLLLGDPQLKALDRDPAQNADLLAPDVRILLTGHCDPASASERLLQSGLADSHCYPVHQGLPEFQHLCNSNHFARTFAVHSDRFTHEDMVVL